MEYLGNSSQSPRKSLLLRLKEITIAMWRKDIKKGMKIKDMKAK
jgi:hypothetical protein